MTMVQLFSTRLWSNQLQAAAVAISARVPFRQCPVCMAPSRQLKRHIFAAMQEPVAADEWQLSWTAEGVHARDLLVHLRVNPHPHPLMQPDRAPPLRVPLTLGLESEAVNVAVLVPSAAAAPDWQEELGSIECGGLKVTPSVGGSRAECLSFHA